MKSFLLYLMAVLYVAAGVYHFISPATYLKIMPHFLPWPNGFNYLAGVLEVLFGVMLFFRATRNVAAWGLVILLIVIFPANIQMAINYTEENHPLLWAAYLRLPLQFLLAWCAFIYTDWYRLHKH